MKELISLQENMKKLLTSSVAAHKILVESFRLVSIEESFKTFEICKGLCTPFERWHLTSSWKLVCT